MKAVDRVTPLVYRGGQEQMVRRRFRAGTSLERAMDFRVGGAAAAAMAQRHRDRLRALTGHCPRSGSYYLRMI